MKEVAMELEAIHQESQKSTGNVQHIYEIIEPYYIVPTSTGSTSDSIFLSVDVKWQEEKRIKGICFLTSYYRD